jgi:hypothetical protein
MIRFLRVSLAPLSRGVARYEPGGFETKPLCPLDISPWQGSYGNTRFLFLRFVRIVGDREDYHGEMKVNSTKIYVQRQGKTLFQYIRQISPLLFMARIIGGVIIGIQKHMEEISTSHGHFLNNFMNFKKMFQESLFLMDSRKILNTRIIRIITRIRTSWIHAPILKTHIIV